VILRGIVSRASLAMLTLAAALALAGAASSEAASGGDWDRAWGKDVVTGGGTGFEICTEAASCKQGALGGLGGEMSFPIGVATDAAGNVYVVDFNHRIQKFDSQGNWKRAWGKDVVSGGGTGFEICTNRATCKSGETGGLGGELNSPDNVAADAAGNVYVTDRVNHRVQKFDSDGNFLRAWGKDVVSGGGTGFEICTSPGACQTGTFGGLGGEMNQPAGLGTDAAGAVYITDPSNQRIQKFDSQGNFLRAWGKDVVTGGGTGFEICTNAGSCKVGVGGGLGGEMNFPSAVAVEGGSVYATTGSHRVQKFDTGGTWERAWGRDVVSGGGTDFEICIVAPNCKQGVQSGLGGEMNFPSGVAVDAAGRVYISDFSNHRIQKFDSQGNWERAWGKDVVSGGGTGFEICTTATSCQAGTVGFLGGELNGPRGIATDGAGSVYVAGNGSHRIERFAGPASCKGQAATHIGTPGPDTITGTPGRDVVVTLGAADRIVTGAGNDLVCAGAGPDRVFAGAGVDRVLGAAGADRIFGGPGRDFLFGQGGFDRLFGAAGGDRLFGGPGFDRLFGGPGFDRLFGGGGNDRAFGGAGRDLLVGHAGRDRLFGGPSRDTLRGLAGRPDRCFGGPGRDLRRARGCEIRRSIP
jgi:uncharacterized protein (DUF2147 family)